MIVDRYYQARLQDLGAPVRFIKRGLNLYSNLITIEQNHIFNLYYINSECAMLYNF
jgi:hypothetical protein